MLRPSQLIGSQFLQDHNNRAIIADVAGTGKTLTILDAVTKKKAYPVLVVCNKPGLYVWSNELNKWFDKPSVVYSGEPKIRSSRLQEFTTNSNIEFLITNYAFLDEIITKLGPFFFKVLILDEYHLPGLLNRKTDIYLTVKELAKLIPHIILSTGTPMRQNPSDWYSPLSLIDRDTFSSYWKFVDDYCIKINNGFGFDIERTPRNTDVFLNLLSKYRIRRIDKSDLPDKIRQPIPVEMTPMQKAIYDQLHSEMVVEHDGKFLITPNKMVKILRCRQLLASPRLLDFKDNGGALNVLTELTEEELSEGNPVAIFTPFRKAIPLIEKELKKVKDLKVFIIHGGMTSEEFGNAQKGFQEEPSKNKVIIVTIKSGTAMTLTEANVAIFLGYELSVHDNSQAEDRLHRIGQKETVHCYYLLYKDTVDEWGISLLNDKTKALAMDVSPELYYQKLVDS